MEMRVSLRAMLFCLLLALTFATPALFAQSTTATLQGTVTDQTGAVVPNATVTATNQGTNVTRTAKTGSTGDYLIPALPVGAYQVEVQASGMGRQIAKGLTLEVGRTVMRNFALKPASVAETIEITSEAPVVESTTITVGMVVDTRKVQELPLNGRHVLDLSSIVPGTVVPPANGFLTAAIRGQGSLGVNTAGTREGTTNFAVNGINVVDMGNGQITFQPSINTVSEFKMDNSTPSAEYGRNAGGIINVGTRSGTNSFHGEVFDFLRNEDLDARNFFNKASVAKAPFKRNDFGAAVGGPIWKNHTFFFISYEGLRQRQGIPVSTDVLTDAERATIAAGSNSTLKQLLTQIPAANSSTNLFVASLLTPVNLDQWTGDFSHNFSEKDRLHGYYVFQKDLRKEPTLNGGNVPDQGDTREGRRQILTLNETHVFNPNVVNDIRAGFNRIHISFNPDNLMDPSAIGISDGRSGPVGIPQTTIGGMNLIFGGITGFPQARGDYTAVLSDTVSYLHGRHVFKFGAEGRRFNGNSFTADAGTMGFANRAAFIAGTPNAFSISTGNRPARVYESAFGMFAMDSFKLRPYLTLELGMRWDWNMSPTESQNRTSLFLPDKDWLVQVGDPSRTNIYNQNKKLFQPRLGFSWDVFRDGKTILRSGYGIMYDQPNPITFATNFPYSVPLRFTSSAGKPTTTFATLAADAKGSGFTVGTIDPNFKNDYIQSWNLNIQHEITPTLSMMLGYFGNKGTHLDTVVNINQLVPGATPGTYVRPFVSLAATSPILPNPADPAAPPNLLGNINERASIGTSNYNALWASVNMRMSHGLQLGANYAWSRTLDDTSRSGLAVMDSTHPFLDYGPADFDATHNFNFNALYQLPFKGNRLFAGWRLSGVLTLQTGNPLNITSGNPSSGTSITSGFTGLGGIRPDLTGALPSVGPTLLPNGNVQWFTSGNTLICDPTKAGSCTASSIFTIPVQVVGGKNVFHFGNLTRNALRGPGFSNLDFSITKTTKITERFSHELRVEAFDLFNHPNFANPGLAAQIGSSSFGVISGTRGAPGDAGSSRQIQFAMKLIF
jgi:Carboxypeptidase regulatory-like domain